MNQDKKTNNNGNNKRFGGNKPRGAKKPQAEKEPSEFTEKVVHINRCAKVVKGGRRFSFSALVVLGDKKGKVGVGFGKAKEVPECIRKATEQAKKNLVTISLNMDSIPHQIIGKADGGSVFLKPARPGTGVVAGGGVRAVLEVVGVKDILTKSLGSNNPHAMVKATMKGLMGLRSEAQIKALRSA